MPRVKKTDADRQREGRLATMKSLSAAHEGRRRVRRRKAVASQNYVRAMAEAVTAEDARAIAKRVLRSAKSGDKAALDWIGKYLFGGGKVTLADLADPGPLRE
jgi:hypothetical protein